MFLRILFITPKSSLIASFSKHISVIILGCIGDCRVRNIYLDSDTAVERKRVNVDKNGCPCVGIVCLNGGVCVAGSPPYCLCKDGFTGYNCGTPIRPETGKFYQDHLLFVMMTINILVSIFVICARRGSLSRIMQNQSGILSFLHLLHHVFLYSPFTSLHCVSLFPFHISSLCFSSLSQDTSFLCLSKGSIVPATYEITADSTHGFIVFPLPPTLSQSCNEYEKS